GPDSTSRPAGFNTLTNDSCASGGSVNVITTRDGALASWAPLGGFDLRTSACAPAEGANATITAPATRARTSALRTGTAQFPVSADAFSGRAPSRPRPPRPWPGRRTRDTVTPAQDTLGRAFPVRPKA